nr:putative carbohydrate binding domain containing protein [uncultured Mediterranean phage uvMED]
MATINLGRVKPVFRGAYAGGTAYVVDDIVTSGNETFICIQASTGNATSNASYWTKLAAKGTDGTDGTDVGTTITTQGDILYRDGSGLQRLGAGTSGQVLTTGGTGANPSWGTVSSDFVKLTSASDINSSSYSVDGFFSSTYTHYMFVFSTVRSSNTAVVYSRINSGGSQHSNGDYKYSVIQAYRDSSGSSNSIGASAWGATEYRMSCDNPGNNGTGHLIVHLNDPQANARTSIQTDYNYMRGDTQTMQRAMGGCIVDYTGAIATGMTFFTGSGNFKAEHFALYGLKA